MRGKRQQIAWTCTATQNIHLATFNEGLNVSTVSTTTSHYELIAHFILLLQYARAGDCLNRK